MKIKHPSSSARCQIINTVPQFSKVLTLVLLVSYIYTFSNKFQTKSDSNSRLVLDEDDNGKFRLERVNAMLLSLKLAHPQKVLLAQFSLYVHNGGLKPHSFHFILKLAWNRINTAPAGVEFNKLILIVPELIYSYYERQVYVLVAVSMQEQYYIEIILQF